jgi:metal-dependent HD superfamily phosphatase/phosphodiesterase
MPEIVQAIWERDEYSREAVEVGVLILKMADGTETRERMTFRKASVKLHQLNARSMFQLPR